MKGFNFSPEQDEINAEIARQKEIKKLYRKISLKIHTDKWNNFSDDIKKEAQDLFSDLGSIKNPGYNRVKGQNGETRSGVEKTSQEILDEMKSFEAEVDEFAERHKGANGASANGAEDAKNKNQQKAESEKKISEGIRDSKSFDELFDVIRQNGGIQGSRQFFKANELIDLINQVRNKSKMINKITNTFGLRSKVSLLLELEAEQDADARKQNNQNGGDKNSNPEDDQRNSGSRSIYEENQEKIRTMESDAEIAERESAEKNEENIYGENGEDIKETEAENQTEEADPELEKLQKKVEETRNLYVKKNYETTSIINRLKISSIKNYFKLEPRNTSDVQLLFGNYKSALTDLLEYRKEKIKNEEYLSRELQLEKIIKYFNQDEKVELYGAYTNVRAEILEKKFGKTPGWMMDKANKFTNWYKKVDWKAKVGISVLAGISGLGLVVAGQRIIGGAVAGVGAANLMKAFHENKENKRLAEEREEIKKELESEGERHSGLMYAKLMEKMQKEINGYENALNTEKKKAFQRKAVGVGVAIFLGSGMATSLFQRGAEASGLKSYFGSLYDKYGLGLGKIGGEASNYESGFDPRYSDVPNYEPGISDKVVEQEIPVSGDAKDKVAEKILDNNADVSEVETKTIKPQVIYIEKGSSFEGSIIKHLEGTGVDHKEAGRMAHRMWLEYIKINPEASNIDFLKIHPNAQIELGVDADGHYHVASFEDSKPADWNKIIEDKPEAPKAPVENNTSTFSEAPKAGTPVENEIPKFPENSEIPKASVEDSVPQSPEVPVEDKSPEILASSGDASERLASVISPEDDIDKAEMMAGATISGGAIGVGLSAEALKNKLAVDKKFRLIKGEGSVFRLRKLVKGLAGNSYAWEKIKDADFTEVSDRNNSIGVELTNRIKSMHKGFVKFLGKEAKAKKEETVAKWLVRMTKLSLQAERNKNEDNQKVLAEMELKEAA